MTNRTKEQKGGLCWGQQLNIMAAFANYLGEGMTADQLGLLSAFLQSVGESLDVIASARQLCENSRQDIIGE
ncbi:hypothetical protein [Ruminococcus sp.]|uniref:hypothetical protein n=1 Tax=Ruminococcus sp. TaxID=41978 RepID=UPI0025CD8EB3|nr:hypothetical protein [Ruminococcus sp.]